MLEVPVQLVEDKPVPEVAVEWLETPCIINLRLQMTLQMFQSDVEVKLKTVSFFVEFFQTIVLSKNT